MIKKIYLILTGEDEKKRPRSKKLLDIIRTHNLQDDEYKIIVSGYSGFLLNVETSESYNVSEYLISKGISKNNIVLEEIQWIRWEICIFQCKKLGRYWGQLIQMMPSQFV